MKWWSGDLPRPGQPPGNETWGGRWGGTVGGAPLAVVPAPQKGREREGFRVGPSLADAPLAIPRHRTPVPSPLVFTPWPSFRGLLVRLPQAATAGALHALPGDMPRARPPPRAAQVRAASVALSLAQGGAQRAAAPHRSAPVGGGLRPGASSVSCLLPATCRTPSWSAATRPRVSWREPPCAISRNCEGLGRGQRFVL